MANCISYIFQPLRFLASTCRVFTDQVYNFRDIICKTAQSMEKMPKDNLFYWDTKLSKVPIPSAYVEEAADYIYSSQNGSTCSQYTAWSAEIAQVRISELTNFQMHIYLKEWYLSILDYNLTCSISNMFIILHQEIMRIKPMSWREAKSYTQLVVWIKLFDELLLGDPTAAWNLFGGSSAFLRWKFIFHLPSFVLWLRIVLYCILNASNVFL